MNQPKPKASKRDQIHEDIVAYLDGELDPESSRQIEQRLAKDGPYRRRLQELERVWDCLDKLPRTDVDNSYTQSTVEMITVAATKDAKRAAARGAGRKWYRWTGSGIAVAVAAVIGYVVVAMNPRSTNNQLLNDLPVIQNVDFYLYADNIEFLRQLQEEGLFDDDVDNVW